VKDVLEQQLPAWRALPPAPAGEFFTVLIGSNDVMNPMHRRALPDAFEELLAALPAGALVASVPSPSGPARQANDRLAEYARTGQVRAVPTLGLGPTAWRGRLAEDRFHPNDEGYALIASVFEPFVRDAAAISLA
jgi:lysophospholipase L1-like esterase